MSVCRRNSVAVHWWRWFSDVRWIVPRSVAGGAVQYFQLLLLPYVSTPPVSYFLMFLVFILFFMLLLIRTCFCPVISVHYGISYRFAVLYNLNGSSGSNGKDKKRQLASYLSGLLTGSVMKNGRRWVGGGWYEVLGLGSARFEKLLFREMVGVNFSSAGGNCSRLLKLYLFPRYLKGTRILRSRHHWS